MTLQVSDQVIGKGVKG